MPRKKVSLPPEEVHHLSGLSGQALRDRARELFEAGWSLAAIGESCAPPRSRSTVQSWVSPSSSAASSSSSLIAAAENSHSHPSPPAPSPTSSPAATSSTGRRRRAAPYDPEHPMLDPVTAARLATISPVARQYRSGANPTGEYAKANDALTRICKEEFARGVSIRELSVAAGVTYKAIEKRIKS